jgi:hypothetical protein
MSSRLKKPKRCTACEASIRSVQDRHYRHGRLVCRECIYGDGPAPAVTLDGPALPTIRPERVARVRLDEAPATIIDFTRPSPED